MKEESLWYKKSPEIKTIPPGPKVRELYKKAGLPLSSISPIAERAEGVWIQDPDGNVFLDFISEHSVSNVGHRHPRIVKVLHKQIEQVTHGFTKQKIMLIDELARITPGDFPKKAFYSLSGSAANDCAIKLSRWSTRKPYIITFTGAYHGLTYGALSVSSYLPKMVRGYGPNVPGIYHMPYPYCYRCPFDLNYPDCNLRCLRYIEDYAFSSYLPSEEVAAIIFEPIEGDAGWIVPPDGWVQGLDELCKRHEIKLIAEEIQTGFGRTGKWFACDHWGIEPDIIVIGKSMAGGVPLSAVVGNEDLFKRGNKSFIQGHSFSGHPLGCVATLENISIIEDEELIENSEVMGKYITKRLKEMMDQYKIIGDVRGKGLLIGVEIIKDEESKKPGINEADAICARAYKNGLYIIRMGAFGTANIRIAPPLVITIEQTDSALEILEEAIKKTN